MAKVQAIFFFWKNILKLSLYQKYPNRLYCKIDKDKKRDVLKVLGEFHWIKIAYSE
jgi:hypothetical protein